MGGGVELKMIIIIALFDFYPSTFDYDKYLPYHNSHLIGGFAILEESGDASV